MCSVLIVDQIEKRLKKTYRGIRQLDLDYKTIFFNRVWTNEYIFFVHYESKIWILIGYVDIIIRFVSLDIWSKPNF